MNDRPSVPSAPKRIRNLVGAVRRRATYGNVVGSIALFVALGGTSYAVLSVESRDVVDNTLRSRDIRNGSLRSRDVRDRNLHARDLRRNSLGAGVVKESALGPVPEARTAERLGGMTAEDFRVRCPADTVAKAGVCIETVPRPPDGFFGATNRCDNLGRGLVTFTQLERFATTSALPQTEWTADVFRNPDNGPSATAQLETVVLSGGGDVSYDRVNLPVQHAFRCVALPSN
jgi:hypothetical protein